MNLALIRRLLQEGSVVVLLEEGHPPLVVRQLKTEEPTEEVPIASRWPKARPLGEPRGRSVFDGRRSGDQADEVPREFRSFGEATGKQQEEVMERLNKEISALKEQIAQEETVNVEGSEG